MLYVKLFVFNGAVRLSSMGWNEPSRPRFSQQIRPKGPVCRVWDLATDLATETKIILSGMEYKVCTYVFIGL